MSDLEHPATNPMTIDRKLRSPAAVFYEYSADGGALLREAADAIDRLTAELAEAREANRLALHTGLMQEAVIADLRNAQEATGTRTMEADFERFLSERVREAVAWLAANAKGLPMDLWNYHSNVLLGAADRLESSAPPQDQVVNELKAECNHFVNGECRTLACLKRDGHRAAMPITLIGCTEYRAVKEIERLREYEWMYKDLCK